MTEPGKRKAENSEEHVVETIKREVSRMEEARRNPSHGILFGLGMFGVVGWSIAVPTIAGVYLGLWLDRIWPAVFSWTISLLFVGVMLGVVVAWRWIRRNQS